MNPREMWHRLTPAQQRALATAGELRLRRTAPGTLPSRAKTWIHNGGGLLDETVRRATVTALVRLELIVCAGSRWEPTATGREVLGEAS